MQGYENRVWLWHTRHAHWRRLNADLSDLPSPNMPLPPSPNATRHFVVVLNEESGTVIRLGKDVVIEILTRVFEEGGIRMTLHCVKAQELPAILKKAAAIDADACIIGGGDGTVASAATLLAGAQKVMGVLPLGTFNLAARDLGMPLDIEEAARALASAPVVAMDAMELNGRLYLCLMVLGFYPTLKIAQPEHHGLWLVRAWKTLRASLHHAATFPRLELELVEKGKSIRCRTRVALITNNDYDEVFGVLPQRSGLNGGFFTVYVSRHRTRLGMLRSFIAWIIGRWKQDREVMRLQTSELTIHARKKRTLLVMMDGEVERLPLPLRITLRPGVLNVLAPSAATAEEAQKE